MSSSRFRFGFHRFASHLKHRRVPISDELVNVEYSLHLSAWRCLYEIIRQSKYAYTQCEPHAICVVQTLRDCWAWTQKKKRISITVFFNVNVLNRNYMLKLELIKFSGLVTPGTFFTWVSLAVQFRMKQNKKNVVDVSLINPIPSILFFFFRPKPWLIPLFHRCFLKIEILCLDNPGHKYGNMALFSWFNKCGRKHIQRCTRKLIELFPDSQTSRMQSVNIQFLHWIWLIAPELIIWTWKIIKHEAATASL